MTIDIIETPRVLADGFQFTECPRWHDGMLYFCDMHDGAIHRMDESGATELVCRIEGKAGGIGFLADGSMLVAAMDQGRILRLRNGKMEVHADLSSLLRAGLNDMIVSPEGRCYVARYFHPDPPYNEPLLFVDEHGGVHESADTLFVANGMWLSPDGKRLVVAESGASELALFDIAPDGAPINRRLFARLQQDTSPDGIGGDDAGGIWAACCRGEGVLRVVEGGEVTHRVRFGAGKFAYACTLGGSAGDTLFICTSGAFNAETHRSEGGARIEAVRVPFRQAGTP